ncbi:MAG: VWA domain-containing protein [Candidatus Lokiarchaeota archaeon]|nr:VWA domain-containing protein [Candidatus Lokiarchaeota archaeon]
MSQQTDEIGDFDGNCVLDWNPITFTVEFIYRMRKTQKKLLNIPSTRQAVAIPKLLTAMYYRKNNLIHEDFITAAVITTPIEDQNIAREIANEILFPKQPKKKGSITKTSSDLSTKDVLSDSEDKDFMDDLLSEFVDAGISLDNLDANDLMDQTLKDFTDLMEFIDDVYEKAAAGMEPYQSLVDILDRRNGYYEIMSKSINTLEMLKNLVHQTIIMEMDVLSPQDIISSTKLNWGQDILDQTKTPWIQATTQFCMNHPDFKKTLSQIMQHEDVGTAAKTSRYLKEAGIDKKIAEDLAKQLIKRAEVLMDIMEISRVLGYIPQFDQNSVFSNSLKNDIGTPFNISRSLDSQFGSQLTKDLYDMWAQQNPKPILSDAFQAQTDVPQWSKMFSDSVQRQLNEISKKQGRPAYEMNTLAENLMQMSKNAYFESSKASFQQNAGIAGLKALETSQTAEDFENILRSQVQFDIPLDTETVLKIGKQKGVSEQTILEILGGNYELLKLMFTNNVGNFNRLSRIINHLKSLNHAQMQELMQLALKSSNFQALGALGHHNMGNAFKAAGDIGGGKAQRQLAESLSAGPGDNLLLQWFLHRHNIPRDVKNFARNLVKDALIKIALNMISNQRGSGEKGLVPTNKLRIFIDGDDMDLVDVDASIENIIMQGKSLDLITTDDLMVHEIEKGRVSICFLLDISGSMSGMKLAACSIAVMVLIGSLLADEVAICFFESNTHIVKEFGDEKDLEDVADELLDLKATGGTRVQAALKWGADQLEQTNVEMKLCFLLTDCMFFEKEIQIKKELEAYVNQKVKFILGVNTRSYTKKYADWILEMTKGEIVYILNIPDIPKILTETLEKIG